MPTPVVPNSPFLSNKLLSFDIYGTLVDHRGGIEHGLAPLLARLDGNSTIDSVHEVFRKCEQAMAEAHPSMHYSSRLAETYLNTASSLKLSTLSTADALQAEAEAFGTSVGSWPVFPDTIDAMQRLSKHFKLVALSNCDHVSYQATMAQALQGKVCFDAFYIAEDIGSYKPDLRNFEYLLSHVDKQFGVDKKHVLHVAQGLWYDHMATKPMGMSSVWIDRYGDQDVHKLVEEERVGFGWRFASLGQLADAVEKEAAATAAKA